MIIYTQYVLATGKPLSTHTSVNMGSVVVPAGIGAIEGDYRADEYKIIDGAAVEKDDLLSAWNFETAQAGSEFILAVLPVCRITVDVFDRYDVTDGIFEIALPDVGEYNVRVAGDTIKTKLFLLTVTE